MSPTSPVAISLYLFISAAVLAAILGVFLIVPLLRNTCTWFNGRCTGIVVQQGPSNTLLITNQNSGYSYYYDGTYIFAYGDLLAGTCPSAVVTGATRDAVDGKTIPSFCYQVVPDPTDPTKTLCEDQQECVRYSIRYPLRVNKTGEQYTCDPSAFVEDAKVSPGSDSWQWTASPQCCNLIVPCPTQGPGDPKQTCVTWALGETPTPTGPPRYTCDGTVYSTERFCCECKAPFTPQTFGGTTQAHGQLFQPAFAVNAATMELVGNNGGVMCARTSNLLTNDFKNIKPVMLNVNIPLKNNSLDVFQLFDVLKRKRLFHPPPPQK